MRERIAALIEAQRKAEEEARQQALQQQQQQSGSPSGSGGSTSGQRSARLWVQRLSRSQGTGHCRPLRHPPSWPPATAR